MPPSHTEQIRIITRDIPMNIFATDPDPMKSAVILDDKRVNKMITESCQMLAAALIKHGCPEGELPISKATGMPYRLTHAKHPCTIWAGENRENFMWLFEHMYHLVAEFKKRYGHDHYGATNLARLKEAAKYIPEGERTPFPNCSLYKEEINVYLAYKMTMIDKWKKDKIKPSWTNTNKPWSEI
jgi:hypothetical protein